MSKPSKTSAINQYLRYGKNTGVNMSKALRSFVKWAFVGATVVVIAFGATVLSSHLSIADYIDRSHATPGSSLLCSGVNYPPGNYNIPDTYISYGKSHGWPFRYKTEIGGVAWDHCNNDIDTSNTIELPNPKDTLNRKNFVLNMLVYAVPATGIALLLARVVRLNKKRRNQHE